MQKAIFFTIILGLLLFSCKKEDKEATTNLTEIKADSVAGMPIDTIHTGDNSETSLDWDGIYVGITPCANCEGIETELTLGKDKTFVLKTKYIGKGSEKTNAEKGTFSWDESGSVIILNGLEHKPNQYKVGENHLVQMDMQGKIVEGNLASKYILQKK
ncbi:NlpE N-terminal domain-containing protein [Flavobacterium sp. 9R]|uniref:copper resistance protein NlpE n=1 Tax=Flavobacterium sp. 9R TaxID=2653143 RepID=UPI0012F454C6|nr:copper resistance protein NlpE [Flavobacterium sp. 9R]VXB76919.1 NlpE N-terminal domain-containing protein [Flavobacterium sp. 9R]